MAYQTTPLLTFSPLIRLMHHHNKHNINTEWSVIICFWIIWSINIVLASHIIMQTTWFVPSKLLINLPQWKSFPKNACDQGGLQLALLQGGSRSPTVIIQDLLHNVRFIIIKKRLNFYFINYHSSTLWGKLQRTTRKFALDSCCIRSITGGLWGILCLTLQGYKLVCNPCEEGRHQVKRH